MNGSVPPLKEKIPFWIVLVCLATLVFGIADHDLWTPDEPREAAIAYDMATGGSLLVPRLAGEPFVEKPPLYYWASALMMRTLGKAVGETAAARMLSSICAALTLLVVWRVAKRYLGGDRALAVVMVLLTMAGFSFAAHRIIIDPLLMLLSTTAILLLFRGLDGNKPLPLLCGYLAAGLAFLTKGFVAWGVIAIPWAVLLVLYFRVIRRRPLLHLAGLVLLFGPGIAWAAAFYSRGGPDLFREWFMDNQVGRFLGSSGHLGHIRGPFYYLPLILALLLPWTPAFIGWVAHARWRKAPGDAPGARNLVWLAVAWSFGGLILLSIAGTKRDLYLFPLLPGFALLAPASIQDPARWVKALLVFICILLLIPMACFSFGTLVWEDGKLIPQWCFNFPIIICTAAGVYAMLRYRCNLLARVAGVGGLFYLAAILAVVPIIDQSKSYGPATIRIARAIPAGEDERVCGWRVDETSRAIFYYYTGLTLTDVRDKVRYDESLKRLQSILDGTDPQFNLVITIVKKKRHFLPEGVHAEPEQVLAQEKMGVRRTVSLIKGKNKSEKQP
ncbi:MAG: glycosyltransferase family 39 protein [Candidatus Tritonobacter lacicola]|nr:glycosyltransferase family 39 protein [Candidatus Tritonobacter lacicola]